MNRFNITAIGCAIALCFSAGAMAAQSMSGDAYKAAQNNIAAEYKAAAARCGSLAANAKDVCMAEAKGKEKVAKAELEARDKPSEQSRYAVSIAKAEADYAVAKEKCDDKAGNAKEVCVKEAKAAEDRAKADAKAQMKTASAATPTKEGATASKVKKESVGEYVDDAVITTKVKAAVLEEPSLKSAEINVETYKGTVQLSGFVRSRADINKAVEVAGKILRAGGIGIDDAQSCASRTKAITCRTTLWPIPRMRDLPLPWGGFIGMAVHLHEEGAT